MSIKEEPIIQVKNLSKQYKIGADTTYKTLSGSITDTLRSPLKTLKNYNKQNEIFWALKDINFEVNRGEVVGIIGRNGAGKSTLLKVLSRITHPTEGEIRLRGRVGSLLEVGTGFHPELTGRENIYFNGAILGMKKLEIDEKFDEIVRFAEIDKFLDTPVKRYSSGMYVRLAFAVAAHMDPEILIVDEVLAVGDAAFQKKCMGKMKDVSEGGRTVLFVSHNMGAIQSLCSKAIWINDGAIVRNGDVKKVVSNYLSGDNPSYRPLWLADQCCSKIKNEILTPLRLALLDNQGKLLPEIIQRNQNVYLELEFDLHKLDRELTIGISVFNEEGFYLFRSQHTDSHESLIPILKLGRNILRMTMPVEILNEGTYRVVLDGGLHKTRWLYNPSLCDIEVKFSISGGLSQSPFWIHSRQGLIAPVIQWEIV